MLAEREYQAILERNYADLLKKASDVLHRSNGYTLKNFNQDVCERLSEIEPDTKPHEALQKLVFFVMCSYVSPNKKRSASYI